MKTTSFEEASRCPRCDQPGEIKLTRSAPDRSQLHIITCMNERCGWFETDWVVQQLEDGTVPVREVQERAPKTFPAVKGMTTEKAREQLDQTLGDDTARRQR